MPAEGFTGPSCSDLVEFMKSIKDIPSKHKGTFDDMSKKAIDTICDIDVVHVWESADDIEDMLQLTQVVMKMMLKAKKQEGRKKREPAMVIISAEQGECWCIAITKGDRIDRLQQRLSPTAPLLSACASSSAISLRLRENLTLTTLSALLMPSSLCVVCLICRKMM